MTERMVKGSANEGTTKVKKKQAMELPMLIEYNQVWAGIVVEERLSSASKGEEQRRGSVCEESRYKAEDYANRPAVRSLQTEHPIVN